MKPIRYTCALVLTAILLVFLPGCASTVMTSSPVIDTPSVAMTIPQAKAALADAIGHIAFVKKTNIKVKHAEATYLSTYRDKTDSCRLRYSSMNNITISQSGYYSEIHVDGRLFYTDQNKRTAVMFWHYDNPDNKRYATIFVDAILTLKKAALEPDMEEQAAFDAFAASAKAWLVAMPKPTMSDEALTYKLLAEDAFKRKDFAAALESYGVALEKFPLWPSGHYNAALLAAETEDWELAAHHMRRYLVLAPDATDAATSKEKLLLWQHKAKE